MNLLFVMNNNWRNEETFRNPMKRVIDTFCKSFFILLTYLYNYLLCPEMMMIQTKGYVLLGCQPHCLQKFNCQFLSLETLFYQCDSTFHGPKNIQLVIDKTIDQNHSCIIIIAMVNVNIIKIIHVFWFF